MIAPAMKAMAAIIQSLGCIVLRKSIIRSCSECVL